jgi:hypothetical protein
MVAHTCHPRYAGSVNRRIIVQTGLGINMRLLSKIYLKATKPGGMVQVVEHLPKSASP